MKKTHWMFSALMGVLVLAAAASATRNAASADEAAPAKAFYDAALEFPSNAVKDRTWEFGELPAGKTPQPDRFTVLDALQSSDWLKYVGSDKSHAIIGLNATDSVTVCTPAPQLRYPPGQLVMHPSDGGNYAALRWKAPGPGTYTLSFEYGGLDPQGPTTTDVHVFQNEVELHSGEVNAYGPPSRRQFIRTLTLNAGDRIVIAAGWGRNKNYASDSTAVVARVMSGAVSPNLIATRLRFPPPNGGTASTANADRNGLLHLPTSDPASWKVFAIGGADVKLSTEQQALRIETAHPDGTDWHVMVMQSGIPLVRDEIYVVR